MICSWRGLRFGACATLKTFVYMHMDVRQFEQAVADHQRMVFNLALHVLRDRALAEELAQDVFLSLYQHGDRIESPEHLMRWLRQVTVRRCLDQLRRRRYRRWLQLSEIEYGVEIPGGSSHSPSRDPWLAGRLQRLIRALPPAVRVVLVLRYQQDLDVAEIGRLLGLTEPGVRKKLRQALTHLKLRLESPRISGPRGPALPPGASETALSSDSQAQNGAELLRSYTRSQVRGPRPAQPRG